MRAYRSMYFYKFFAERTFVIPIILHDKVFYFFSLFQK